MGAGGGSQILQGWECDGVITHCLLSTEFWASLSIHNRWRSDHPWSMHVVIQLLSCLSLSVTHGLQHARLSCPSLCPRVCSDSCPLSRWCHPTISSSVIPFSFHLQSFLASGSFPMSQLFISGDQSIGISASASVLPMNIQSWFSLELTGLISLQSKDLSRAFPSTAIWKHQFFGSQPPTSLYDYWKNQSFDYTNLCQQGDIFAS